MPPVKCTGKSLEFKLPGLPASRLRAQAILTVLWQYFYISFGNIDVLNSIPKDPHDYSLP